jgi:flavin reductase (DIM6/NTAB) family NADH-FMN oxidoreductase RutF
VIVKLGAKDCLHPLPVVLVGANVDGRTNHALIARVGSGDLPGICLAMSRAHHTSPEITKEGMSSVNAPSAEMMEKTES